MDPTIPDPIPDPTVQTPPTGAPAVAPARGRFRDRLDLAATLVISAATIELLAVLAASTAGDGEFGDQFREASSDALDVRFGLLLVAAAVLATLPESGFGGEPRPRSDLGRIALMVTAVVAVLVAIIGLIGIGQDLSEETAQLFGVGDAEGASVLHRLASVVMAVVAAGWALSALGVRVTTTRP